jgi:hypothetical protein
MLLALCLWLLAGCAPLYLPPVPEPPVVAAPTAPLLSGSPGVEWTVDGGLALHLRLGEMPREGWLEVQWFSPENRQVASDAAWVRPADAGGRVVLPLPAAVRVTPGTWRAVASFRGVFLRQFALEVLDAPSLP